MIARSFLMRQSMIVADMGTGKTHIGMGLSAFSLTEKQADTVLIICEKNKLLDWHGELAEHTSLGPVAVYHGPRRAQALLEPFQVLITTYETARQDLASFASSRARKGTDGPLLLALLGRRAVIIFDEISAKLGNRSSRTYKAHAHMLTRLRARDPALIVAGMTGTPIERDWENAYNAMRLLMPGLMPMVKDFEARYTYGRDDYGRLRFRKERMPEFAALCAPRMLRKRKTDPDVRDQFPVMTEEFITCEMHPDQARVYKIAEDLAWDDDGEQHDVPGLRTVLRQIAGHPAAVLRSEGKLARIMQESFARPLLASSSCKAELLLEYARRLMDEDAKGVVFTFFGQSVLPVLAEELRRDGIPLFLTHGGMSAAEQQDQRTAFRTCAGGAILATSDAGARGVNLPEATCVMEYEAGLTHALRTQRFARAHRIGHGGAPLTCITFVTEKTIEVPLLKNALNRNEQQDTLLGDNTLDALYDGYMTAGQRRALYSQARRRRG